MKLEYGRRAPSRARGFVETGRLLPRSYDGSNPAGAVYAQAASLVARGRMFQRLCGGKKFILCVRQHADTKKKKTLGSMAYNGQSRVLRTVCY